MGEAIRFILTGRLHKIRLNRVMDKTNIEIKNPTGQSVTVPTTWVHTLIVGTGAAGLNAAIQLHNKGIDDVLIVTEGLDKGTSVNAGSDKQTYYKLGMCGSDADSPYAMAETYFAGGSMHGDIALIESALSARAFFHLVELGVLFPHDKFGQFAGYKTDHDPRQRATSTGPYTSRDMCNALRKKALAVNIPIREQREIVTLLTTTDDSGKARVAGAVAIGPGSHLEAYVCENIIFAVGGPGGLYSTSAYPEGHTGSIGLALLAGAKACNLPESQFGLASTKFKWNVSGTYMQVIPRVISTAPDGISDEKEFLLDHFGSPGKMHSNVFLKGYQWPFDSARVIDGSSIIDVLIHIETAVMPRRVFLDFRSNPSQFTFDNLEDEASMHLKNSGAMQDTPLARLQHMNPAAAALYSEHGIDLSREPLEVAVCAQHNNGGLAGNIWWESTTLGNFFPIGEVNGSHGVRRPGGAALNAGQVGGFRAAELIAGRSGRITIDTTTATRLVHEAATSLLEWRDKCGHAPKKWQDETGEFQARMTEAGAHLRSRTTLQNAVEQARAQWTRISTEGCRFDSPEQASKAFSTRHLCFAHLAYLEAILFAVESGTGSRGSAMVLDKNGITLRKTLDEKWQMMEEDITFREKLLQTQVCKDGTIENLWMDRRPIPETNTWFETVWADFRTRRPSSD